MRCFVFLIHKDVTVVMDIVQTKKNKYASLDLLLPYVNKQLGLYYIQTNLSSVPLKVLNRNFEEVKASPYLGFSTPEHTLNSMIVAHQRLFEQQRITDDIPSESLCRFLKLKFTNKTKDTVNRKNSVKNPYIAYFKTTPYISYNYTFTIAFAYYKLYSA